MVKAGLGSRLSHFESQLCNLRTECPVYLCHGLWGAQKIRQECMEPRVSVQEMSGAIKVVVLKKRSRLRALKPGGSNSSSITCKKQAKY